MQTSLFHVHNSPEIIDTEQLKESWSFLSLVSSIWHFQMNNEVTPRLIFQIWSGHSSLIFDPVIKCWDHRIIDCHKFPLFLYLLNKPPNYFPELLSQSICHCLSRPYITLYIVFPSDVYTQLWTRYPYLRCVRCLNSLKTSHWHQDIVCEGYVCLLVFVVITLI